MTSPVSSPPSVPPFALDAQLLLAGELGNSSASDRATLDGLWPRLVELGLNTVLAPIYWELLEPVEAEFDFSLLDHLLTLARRHGQKLVLLWFGAYKNSMSCYAPAWVKTDLERFPRARLSNGKPLEILSPFSREVLETDRRAFVRLMQYLADNDSARTVVLVQVENEIGMLEEARDACEEANRAFSADVPREILELLASQTGETQSTALKRYRAKGCRSRGNWVEVFGEGLETDELFMAYHFARYVDELAAAGKAVHALPLYVNAALNRDGWLPGAYPSAGPLPHLFDLWKLGAPHLDLISPDIYYPEFELWSQRYRAHNTLFIPEANRGQECIANALYAFGAMSAIGYSPFSVEDMDPKQTPLGSLYATLQGLKETIVSRRNTQKMGAVTLTREQPNQSLVVGSYRFLLRHDCTWEFSSGHQSDQWPKAGALVLELGPDEFLVVGTSVIIRFEPAEATSEHERAGILFIEEGRIESSRFVAGRRLNGDENHQGRHLRIPTPGLGVQRVRLYQYR